MQFKWAYYVYVFLITRQDFINLKKTREKEKKEGWDFHGSVNLEQEKEIH
jgi:hypothetical protein